MEPKIPERASLVDRGMSEPDARIVRMLAMMRQQDRKEDYHMLSESALEEENCPKAGEAQYF